jgi:hypothetical protein
VLTFNPAGVATVVEPPWIGINTFRLVYLAGNLTLARVNGNIIDINGIVYGITSIPVLAGTGAEADHWYYIYLYCVGGTPTLSFSETVPIADSVGRMYKTGDGSYRLMGMAYALVADTWASDPLATTSYDNRKPRTDIRAFTTARSTSAAVWAEINSEMRMPIVAFEGDAVMSTITGNHYGDNATNAVDGYVGLGTDGVVTVSSGYDKKKIVQLTRSTFAVSNVDTIATDGFHYMTVAGGTDPAATQNEIMDASTTLRVSTWG